MYYFEKQMFKKKKKCNITSRNMNSRWQYWIVYINELENVKNT